MDWVAGAAKTSGRPSVASMSILTFFSSAVNDAATNLVASGVTTVVSAGNYDNDAAYWAPSGAPTVITVGSSNIADAMSPWSNWGAIIDVFAPGMQ